MSFEIRVEALVVVDMEVAWEQRREIGTTGDLNLTPLHPPKGTYPRQSQASFSSPFLRSATPSLASFSDD